MLFWLRIILGPLKSIFKQSWVPGCFVVSDKKFFMDFPYAPMLNFHGNLGWSVETLLCDQSVKKWFSENENPSRVQYYKMFKHEFCLEDLHCKIYR